MSFKDIKGQERAIEFFQGSINQQRLAHAYLFLGPAGVGRGLVAKNLAKVVNCEQPLKKEGRTLDCCDRCTSCRKIENFNHPDVHWIRPEQSQSISIDQIRAMQKEVYLKAYEGDLKVFIIQDAQRLTEEAANSLLKTLEEPPAHSLIILISENKSGLLPTITSRCQLIKFYPFQPESLKNILVEDYKLKASDAHYLSFASEGRLGQALSLREEAALDKKNYLIERITQIDNRFSSVNIFDLKDKKELSAQIRYILNWFRDLLVFKTGLDKSHIINADRMEKIKAGARMFTLEDLEKIIDRILQAHGLIERNVNPKIALEVMLGGIAKCRK